jgi:hypothetical protein
MPSIEETVLQYGETCPKRGEISTSVRRKQDEVLGQEGENGTNRSERGKEEAVSPDGKALNIEVSNIHKYISQGGEKMEQR